MHKSSRCQATHRLAIQCARISSVPVDWLLMGSTSSADLGSGGYGDGMTVLGCSAECFYTTTLIFL